MPGLGLVIQPSGARSWVFQGAASHYKRVRLEAVSLHEARKAAMGLKSGLADPTASAPPRPALTVDGLLDGWIAALQGRPSPPVSLARIEACLSNHARPALGMRPVDALSRADVLGLRDGLAASGRRGMANQVVAYLRAALRWAEDTALIKAAPRHRVSRLPLKMRAHTLEHDGWGSLMDLLQDREAGLHPIGRLTLLALALTGCRKGEMATLRWSDIYPDAIRLTRHKTSAKSGPKTIELSDPLRALFGEARQAVIVAAARQPTQRLRDNLLNSPHVFPSLARNSCGRPIGAGLRDVWGEVRERAGLPSTMTIHGLRGAFITQAQQLGVPLATVAALVGHESPLVTLRHYTAPSRGEVARGAGLVAGWIAGVRGPNEGS